MANELMRQVEVQLAERTDEIAKALPEGLTIERFNRMALNAVSANANLLTCDRGSLFISIMQAAQIGLEPDPNLQHVYFIPRKGKACCQVGYRGFVELALRSGRVKSFRAELVREGDLFEFDTGTNPYIKHKPTFGEGKRTHVYAIATLENGHTEFVVLPIAECDRIGKRYSDAFKAGKGFSIWESDYETACKKTALKRLCKLIPCSPRMQAAITVDDTPLVPERSTAETVEEAINEARPVDVKDITPPPKGAFEDSAENPTASADTTGEPGTDEASCQPQATKDTSSPPAPDWDDPLFPVRSELKDLYVKANRSKSLATARECANEACDVACRKGGLDLEVARERCKFNDEWEIDGASRTDCLALIAAFGKMAKGE